jgi:dolichol-phosphate mannosyltransferase
MKVLIGLPAFNEEAGIENVLRSIARFRNVSRYSIEVLVVNDGSTDNTAHVVRDFAKEHDYVSIIDHSKNMGLGEAVKTILR